MSRFAGSLIGTHCVRSPRSAMRAAEANLPLGRGVPFCPRIVAPKTLFA